MEISEPKYRVIQNDCRGFNNLSYTIHLRYGCMYFLFNRTILQVFVTYLIGAWNVVPLNQKIHILLSEVYCL